MKNWFKKLKSNSYCFYDATDSEFRRPLFYIDFFIYGDAPLVYFESHDKNRWKYFGFSIGVSKLDICLAIPYKRLPDYIPNDKIKRIRERWRLKNEKANTNQPTDDGM